MFRLANKALLKKLNDEAARLHYNRQIVPEAIDKLPEDVLIAVSPIMIHEHAQGVPVDPHLRCSVRVLDPIEENVFFEGLFLDVPMRLFELLPELPAREAQREKTEKAAT